MTGDFIFSTSYDKTIKAWLFDTTDIVQGCEADACIRTFKGHGKGVYPLIFIPAEDFDLTDGATINPGDTLISGSADMTARSWSFDTGTCLKVWGINAGSFMCSITSGMYDQHFIHGRAILDLQRPHGSRYVHVGGRYGQNPLHFRRRRNRQVLEYFNRSMPQGKTTKCCCLNLTVM